MRLSIIIPVMNGWAYTKYVLEILKNLDERCEVIVVDNASTDDTKTYLPLYSKKYNNIKYIRNEKNTGFGFAVNQPYKNCNGDIVLFLNNDIKINDKTLSFIYKMIDDISNINYPTLFGPTGGFVDPSDNFNFKYETQSNNKPINYMSGWFLAAKKTTFDQLIVGNNNGPFDAETYFVYYEDTDLGLLANEKEIVFKLYPVPVVHLGGKTSSQLGVSKMFSQSHTKFINKWKHLLTSAR